MKAWTDRANMKLIDRGSIYCCDFHCIFFREASFSHICERFGKTLQEPIRHTTVRCKECLQNPPKELGLNETEE